jgi:hypothetical protein
MAYVDWRITGPELATCNCNWGCPCQFNSLPSDGTCKAAFGMRVDRGHFGEVSLDGVIWAAVVAWPGPIHEGKGEILTIIDERANEQQREAMLAILAGKETEPGATVFNVFATTYDTVHPPQFKPIEFDVDVVHCKGRIAVAGVFEAIGEPIRNPVTGEPHRARVQLPHGFEFSTAEFASSTTKAKRPLALDWDGRHAHFAMLDLGPRGPHRH